MDIVALNSNEKKYLSIHQFMNMSELEREEYRGQIICADCKAKAYYRGASRDGKSPCFGAKHVDDCNRSSTNKNNNNEGDEEVNKINLDNSEFDIQWNYKSLNEGPKRVEGDSDDGFVGKNNKKYAKNPPKTKKAKISLNQILEFAEYDILESQDYLININKTPKVLADIVMKLENVNDDCLNQKMFFWGKFSNFNDSFINTAYENNISILIEEAIRKKFEKLHKHNILKVINNNIVIVFGKVIKTKNDKYLVILKDVKHIYYRKCKSI